MSKIALTPNASGTGTFTLAAPNSNTSRTITLPDEAGEVLVNGTNQNVGIGTSSPSSFFSGASQLVVGSGSGAQGITIYSANNDNAQIFFADGTTGDEVYRGILRYRHDNDAMTFHTAGATERMRIDSSGNVGIGVVPVSSWDTFTALQIEGSSLGALGDNNTILGSNIYHDNNAFKYIGTAAATVYQQRLGEHRWSGAASGTAGSTANMTQHMAINSSGTLLINTTNADVSFSTSSGSAIQPSGQTHHSSAGTALILNRTSSEGTTAQFRKGGVVKGSIEVSSSGTSYNTSSDYRLKTDAQPMTGASARVQALNPVNFEWIVDGTRVDGFLAHEAQAIVPEAVTGTKDAMRDEEYEVTPAVYEDVVIPAVLDEDGNELEAERTEQQLVTEAVMGTRSVPDYQGIDQSKLVPLLTAALQEALTEISDLKARVTALEAV